MNSKALSAEAEISKILDDSIIMIYPATQELSREHLITNWPDDQPSIASSVCSNKGMGYAFVGRVAACSASVPAPARTVSSVKKYRQANYNRHLVRFQAIKEATTLLEDDVEPDEQERALFIESHAAETLDEFDQKSQQLARELALRASDDIPDDISEMGESVDVSFGPFHGRD